MRRVSKNSNLNPSENKIKNKKYKNTNKRKARNKFKKVFTLWIKRNMITLHKSKKKESKLI